MSFTKAVDNFANSLPGTDTYVRLRVEMQHLINTDAAFASVYFLIAGFAKTYVMLYEDQEISPNFAEAGQALLLSYLNMLNDAIKSGNKELVLEAMNNVVIDYENSKKIF